MRETLNKYAENRVHQNVFRPAKKVWMADYVRRVEKITG